jgi:hypothetical protein
MEFNSAFKGLISNIPFQCRPPRKRKILVHIIKVPHLFSVAEKLETREQISNSIDLATSLRAKIFYKINSLASFVKFACILHSGKGISVISYIFDMYMS